MGRGESDLLGEGVGARGLRKGREKDVFVCGLEGPWLNWADSTQTGCLVSNHEVSCFTTRSV